MTIIVSIISRFLDRTPMSTNYAVEKVQFLSRRYDMIEPQILK